MSSPTHAELAGFHETRVIALVAALHSIQNADPASFGGQSRHAFLTYKTRADLASARIAQATFDAEHRSSGSSESNDPADSSKNFASPQNSRARLL